MNNKKVCVYIPSYNYSQFLKEAIESVLRQTYFDWELYLIDDGSDDNSYEIMNLYKTHKKIKILKTKNIGVLKIANKILKLTKSEYFFRLDADDVLDENIFTVLCSHLNFDRDLSLIFPDFYYMDERGKVYASDRRQNVRFNNQLLDIPPNGACTMIRTNVLKKLGGYSKNIKAQDGYDLWNKIIKNYKFKNINIPLFYYRRHNVNLTNNEKIILQNKRLIKEKYSKGNLKNNYPILGIIPCRRYFDFTENLWNKKLGNSNILNTIIKKFSKIKFIKNIIVTSDEIKTKISISKKNKTIFHLRKTELTIRSRSIFETIEEIIQKNDKKFNGLSIIWPIQSPMITEETIKEAVNSLIINDSNSCIIVNQLENPIYQRQETGLRNINNKGFLISDFDKVYLDTRSLIVIRNKNIRDGSLLGSKIIGIEVPNQETIYLDTKSKLNYLNYLFNTK